MKIYCFYCKLLDPSGTKHSSLLNKSGLRDPILHCGLTFNPSKLKKIGTNPHLSYIKNQVNSRRFPFPKVFLLNTEIPNLFKTIFLLLRKIKANIPPFSCTGFTVQVYSHSIPENPPCFPLLN